MSLYKINYQLFRSENELKLVDKTHPLNKKQCSICGDPGQVEMKKAPAIMLNCIDFRLRDNLYCHLNVMGYKNK